MSLLEMLFSGLSENDDLVLPRWEDEENPWSILTAGENGIGAQLLDICDSDSAGRPDYIGDMESVSIDEEEGVVYIHQNAIIGENVKIEGPCYIGDGVEIRHSAYLRRGSWVCSGAVVGHSSEIKNSILLPGAKAPHFNYVGDSVLGFGVNLGAGVKLANVRNDRGTIKVTLPDGKRIDTGLKKMGSLIGDFSQLGCNVVTNPGTMIAQSSSVPPNETIGNWFETKS